MADLAKIVCENSQTRGTVYDEVVHFTDQKKCNLLLEWRSTDQRAVQKFLKMAAESFSKYARPRVCKISQTVLAKSATVRMFRMNRTTLLIHNYVKSVAV